MAVALDRSERAMIPVGFLGGALMGVGTLLVMDAADSFVMLRGTLLTGLGVMLWTPGALAPVLRQRPWALTAGFMPAGVGMVLAFGVAGFVGWGPTVGRPAYTWGSITLASAMAAFGVYAHRDGIRRFNRAQAMTGRP